MVKVILAKCIVLVFSGLFAFWMFRATKFGREEARRPKVILAALQYENYIHSLQRALLYLCGVIAALWGMVLFLPHPQESKPGWVFQLHVPSALILLPLLVTLTFWRNPGTRNSSLHRVLGAWTAVLSIIVVLTGAVLVVKV